MFEDALHSFLSYDLKIRGVDKKQQAAASRCLPRLLGGVIWLKCCSGRRLNLKFGQFRSKRLQIVLETIRQDHDLSRGRGDFPANGVEVHHAVFGLFSRPGDLQNPGINHADLSRQLRADGRGFVKTGQHAIQFLP